MPVRTGGAALSIASGVREFAVATPLATAVVDGDRTLTYRELDDRASRLANVLLPMDRSHLLKQKPRRFGRGPVGRSEPFGSP